MAWAAYSCPDATVAVCDNIAAAWLGTGPTPDIPLGLPEAPLEDSFWEAFWALVEGPEEGCDAITITVAVAVHLERQDPFFSTGGLMAVHAEQRSRTEIWNALERKEVYGTSGDRILLWFDLLNPGLDVNTSVAAMGSELAMQHKPRFKVRAIGARKQFPGCPAHAVDAPGADRLEHLCHAECFYPSDQRKLITRIEVVRIKPQIVPNENVAQLVENVWLSHTYPVAERAWSSPIFLEFSPHSL